MILKIIFKPILTAIEELKEMLKKEIEEINALTEQAKATHEKLDKVMTEVVAIKGALSTAIGTIQSLQDQVLSSATTDMLMGSLAQLGDALNSVKASADSLDALNEDIVPAPELIAEPAPEGVAVEGEPIA